jgi:hypothetical protein
MRRLIVVTVEHRPRSFSFGKTWDPRREISELRVPDDSLIGFGHEIGLCSFDSQTPESGSEILCLEILCTNLSKWSTQEEALRHPPSHLYWDIMAVEDRGNNCYSRLGVGKIDGGIRWDPFADSERVTIRLI